MRLRSCSPAYPEDGTEGNHYGQRSKDNDDVSETNHSNVVASRQFLTETGSGAAAVMRTVWQKTGGVMQQLMPQRELVRGGSLSPAPYLPGLP
jgi:hypothetical protein